ncbi:cytochrome b [Spongiibacter sp. KMU-158]|uniref:Cytochrome b n=1 Tax=Spongiibacter pelagi TaxID=2760804 RepID=A0A927C195_9GAMM|nr:cytochrome b [Spongiibacter pelagi]MBD2857801.1 cytochrome b [Spongiibacter pelagi]
MQLQNSTRRYGAISIAIHWLMALGIIGLFGLGLWMSGLSYYDPWYKQGPFIHKSIGLILLALLVFRFFWRLANARPADAPSLKPWEKSSSHLVHWLLYGLMLTTMIAGYLISTADGRSISVFNWFEVPALISGLPEQEDIAGEIHEILAWAIVAVAGLHALAALKHHFLDRDNTLKKMLGGE